MWRHSLIFDVSGFKYRMQDLYINAFKTNFSVYLVYNPQCSFFPVGEENAGKAAKGMARVIPGGMAAAQAASQGACSEISKARMVSIWLSLDQAACQGKRSLTAYSMNEESHLAIQPGYWNTF